MKITYWLAYRSDINLWGADMEIKIYDQNLLRKGSIENHISLIWTRKYYEPGDFEIHAPLTTRNIQLLKEGYLVSKKDTVEAGVIEDVTVDDAYNSRKIIAKGRFLSSYFDRRLIRTFTFSGNAEEAMRKLYLGVVEIPLIELGELGHFDETITFQATMKNLLTIETKLAKATGLGFRLRPDFKQKKIIFEIYSGKDRSLSQLKNSRVVFSETYGNLNQTTYHVNTQLLKSKAIVGGEGEGEERIYVTVGESEGLDLREVFVDAKDVRSEDFDTTEEYRAALEQRGYDALAENAITESFDGSVDLSGNFKYKEDYDLGDIVTIWKKQWDIRTDKRITEIQEIYENGGMTVVPTFGNALKETVDWSN